MKHKILLITLTCLLFCAICTICVKELFSVKDITVNYSVRTDETEEVLSLLEKYKGKSLFFVDGENIREEITANRYLKVLSVEKKFPNELIVNLVERTETFYYSDESGFYYFDNEYFVIRKESEHIEKGDPLTEIVLTHVNGEKVSANCSLKSVFEIPENLNSKIDLCLDLSNGICDNIQKIIVVYTSEKGNYRIKLQMREGVCIEIRKAGTQFSEKIVAGANYYLALEEARKIDGTVIVDSDDSGRVKAGHTFTD